MACKPDHPCDEPRLRRPTKIRLKDWSGLCKGLEAEGCRSGQAVIRGTGRRTRMFAVLIK
jgi:hypothetical protein